MITVFGRATSSNVQAVMWAVGEIGLDHERLDYGRDFGGLDSAEYRAINPHGLIPVIKDQDTVVWESCAILRYLAARYGSELFWPSDPVRRAAVDMWAEWAKTSFCGAFTGPIFWARVRTAEQDRDQNALTSAIAHFEGQLAVLEPQLQKNGYVAGDHLTLADIVVGHVLFRWFDIDVPRQDRPIIRAFYDRLCARAAYREHVMVPYDVLRAEGS